MAETKPLGTVHAMEQQMIENKQGVFAPAGELRTTKAPQPTTTHAADAPSAKAETPKSEAKPAAKAEAALKADPKAATAKPSVKATALRKGSRK